MTVVQDVSIFQSTLPVRGATADAAIDAASQWISIHAPREGSDLMDLNILVLS